MPPRPFPFPLGIGTDIVHVKRIRAILLRVRDKPQDRGRFLRRFLTPRERAEFRTRFGDVLRSSSPDWDVVSKHLAGRWAAKEAAIKAVTWRRLSFHDVVIRRADGGSSLQAVILDCNLSAAGEEASAVHSASSDVLFGCSPAKDDNADAPRTMGSDDHGNESRDTVKVSKDQLQRSGDKVDLTGQIARISISHDGDYATAVCLAAEGPV